MKKEIILVPLLFIVAFVIGFLGSFLLTGSVELNFETLELEKYDKIGSVSCGSDSMGLTFDCNDRLYQRYVQKDEELKIGLIYIYNSTNGKVAHRLVQCVDSSCNLTVFKGDNNHVAEFVKREDILTEVMRVEYK